MNMYLVAKQEVSNMIDWSRYENSTCTNQSDIIFK